MINRILVSSALLGLSQQNNASPLKNTSGDGIFPVWASPPTVTTHAASKALATADKGGYHCIRAKLYYAFSQGIGGNAVSSSTAL